ncbi:bifunctional tRNA (5-methylaminomethyl-2-thiouridine)(34)-methyltransferase MnmD/FAD-dependent 5-carboxymethylaminomethyl-2-thiouridine(34) oxidoreductase MnmC [Thalassospira sp.]|uniref:bifunctional tRNA (5-methylaminomethyl-2-thiouridine)(34)-methyltransferase MnmD/FAD-dependent 5-carboxymethylaminomethyl-2-thiouridine(34) oxidoreductase MnmC n=1 Tax=Thalassospira sp. TaxID=1912094 RepID=UPI000C53B318|nr:bifunctional tRNA (5-methylaminomethyl-2-thiouridine)(34)-methyltransferase MnmD/FAD-dependent 5-carboxymethylaminomethyl-2-thiouridine(34) oxidoreductase MnmC [Thalassospira sp.]MBC06566.1 bifunctional tRNA (5-methylaminomethyl-2-thiouridine)(34)-methyltransferase MnmD/FAD-dependent 5-carboxymethylaminomethyl-2-thiouridine(34) oxidoreductase MnmC [Thalassospira sp.]|tara:strand:- start:4559 stop:6604 length:2046 start_codon:yes stop_codon:yes gene_type:complete
MTATDGTKAPDGDEPRPAGEITWRDGDVPYSPHFGDIYFNPKDGLSETHYVFVEGNNLPNAWHTRENFVIGETGFGTGLNFLAAWQCWDSDDNRSKRLHFVSVEKYPLSRDDMIRAHQSWPELSQYSEQLADIWPHETMLPGVHRFSLADGAISLTLLIGDAIECWSGYDGKIDCWFLDGFAPSRNPDMWHPDLFTALANASNPDGATLATFTAARIARDGLESAGFVVSKRKGFGYKRDMITASISAPEDTTSLPDAFETADDPWFNLPRTRSAKSVVIIGGGLAGAACANALKARGCAVTLFEKADQLANAASGNPIGMLEPYLTVDEAIMGRFYEAGYRFSHRMIKKLSDQGRVDADFCGVIDLATSARKRERLDGLIARLGDKPDLVEALDTDQASERFGLPLPHGGVFYPSAGWVNPPSVVRSLADGIDVRLSTTITSINDADQGNCLIDESGSEYGPFDAVIIAGAFETRLLDQTQWLEDHLNPVRGQISFIPEDVVSGASEGGAIKCVLSHKGYVTPARDGMHVFGATFGRDDAETDLREGDHAFNIAQFGKVLPEIAEKLSADVLDGRASLRTTTADHLPLIGPAPDFDAYLASYGDIDKGKKGARYVDAPYHKDVYICTGFGARGLIGAPLAAEILASEICDMPLPLEKALMHAIHPARFIIRGLKRRQITA